MSPRIHLYHLIFHTETQMLFQTSYNESISIRVYEEHVPVEDLQSNSVRSEHDVLFIRQIQEGVSLSFLLNVLFCPTISFLFSLQSGSPFLVQAYIDRTQQERDEELHCEKYHYCCLPRNICGCILWLEDFGSNDISNAKRSEGHSIDRNFLRMSARVTGIVCIDTG